MPENNASYFIVSVGLKYRGPSWFPCTGLHIAKFKVSATWALLGRF